MTINHNLISMNIYNNLKINNSDKFNIMQKLSSGSKINKAADDAAGLAISEKMKSQIRGLNQADRNIQDGQSLVQVADGGLNEITDQLQRIRQLSVQASNGTLDDDDRDLIQKEITQLTEGINDVANNTEFNGLKLLNGSIGKSIVTDTTTVTIPSTITISAPQILKYTFTTNPNNGDSAICSNTITNKKAQFNFSNGADKPGYINVQIGSTISDTLNNFVSTFNSVKNNPSDINYDKLQGIDITLYKNSIILTATDKIIGSVGVLGATIAKYSGTPAELVLDTTTTTTGTTTKVVDNSIGLQIGNNSNDTFKISISDMSSNALNLNNIDVSNQISAQNSIGITDDAISKVLSERSKCGAYQNVLEHIYNNVANTSENLTSADSKIEDTDMAKGMMELCRNNVLEQVSQTLLGQANQTPNQVLELLK